MIAEKITVTFTIEVLDITSVNAIAYKAIDQLDQEVTEGRLSHNDGDTVSWATTKTPVTI